jgi:hypothetical protein
LDLSSTKEHYVAILQFAKTFSKTERTKISLQTGIQFMDYIPDNSFIALVPKTLTNVDLKNNQIKTIIPYTFQHKIDSKLLERPFPTWIIVNETDILVLVDILKNVSKQQAKNLFENNGATLVEWKNDRAILKINKNDVEKIASMPIVKIIQSTSSPWKKENLM